MAWDTDIVIPSTYRGLPVKEIGEYAFFSRYDDPRNAALTSISIPDSVTSIGRYAFENCSGLTGELKIPDSVTSIGSFAFMYCDGLTSIKIGSSVTSIGDQAFYGCSELTGELKIPDSVTSIGPYAFYDCDELTSVIIGSGVASIGSYAFYNCSGLTEIKVDSNNQIYHAQDNCLIETKSNTLILGCKTSIIPDDGSVTSIKGGAFYGCSGLTSITIPDCVTLIGISAFEHCSKLKEVHFESPNGWKVSRNGDMSDASPVSGLDNPATAAEHLTNTYYGYIWEREE